MPPNDPQTVLLTSDLGSVGNFDPTAPLSRVVAKDSLHTGHLFLRATLDEMIKIRNMSKSLDENHRDLLRETRAQYDNLVRQQSELESLDRQRPWILKLLKYTSVKRAKRAWVGNTQELWDSTKTTSDRLKRTLLSTPTTDLAPVECESVAKDERISGLAVEMNGPVTQEALAAVQEAVSLLASGDPFADPTPSDAQDTQTATAKTVLDAEVLSSTRSSISTSPSSPGSASSFSYLNLNFNYNVVNNMDTNTEGFTINNNGSGNSGSVVSPRSSENSPPS